MTSTRFAAIIMFFVMVFFQAVEVELGIRDKVDVTWPTRTEKTTECLTRDYHWVITENRYTSQTAPQEADEGIGHVLSFGGINPDIVNSSCSCADGYIVCGNSSSVNTNISGVAKKNGYSLPYGFIIKFSASGDAVWADSIGGNGVTSVSDVAVLKDGSVVAVGYSMATNLINKDAPESTAINAFVYRYSPSGTLLHSYVLNSDGFDYAYCVAPLHDGGYIIGGKTNSLSGDFSFISGNSSAYILAFDSSDNIVNRTAISGTTGGTFMDIAVDESGSIFACCYTNCSNGDFAAFDGLGAGGIDSLILKYSSELSLEWSYVIGGAGEDNFNNVIPDDEGGCLVAGSYRTVHDSGTQTGTFEDIHNWGGEDGYAFFINSDGLVYNSREIAGFYDDVVSSVIRVGNYYCFTGYTKSENRTFNGFSNAGGNDAYVLFTDLTGRRVAIFSIIGSDEDYAYTVCACGDYVVACGTTSSTDGTFSLAVPRITDAQTGFAVTVSLP